MLTDFLAGATIIAHIPTKACPEVIFASRAAKKGAFFDRFVSDAAGSAEDDARAWLVDSRRVLSSS